MKRISVEQVCKLHEKMLIATGGEGGIRNLSLLEAALNNAFATFDGRDLYPSIEEKCANICYCLVNSHPFVDGNKRIGVYVMLVLLEYNGINLHFSQSSLIDLGLVIAEGRYRQDYIVNWIKHHVI